ncbi:MAG: glycosyltransferase family 4 protein [Bacteroidota bacterium]|jgi:glycosyltransferase involved in cell wall biosynthesis
MRICLVAESYPPALGGVEFALQNLVEGFIANAHKVQVISSSWQRHAPSVEKRGTLTVIRVYNLPVFKRFWFMLFSLPSVIRAAQWADVVQGSTFAGGPPAIIGAFLMGKKKALIVHEILGRCWFLFEPNLIRSLFYYLTERIIVGLPFDQFIAVSEYTKKLLQSIGVSEKKIRVIYHGDSKLENLALSIEEVRQQLCFDKEDFVFLSFGRAGVTKGFEYFTEVIPEILRQIPKARFVLIFSSYYNRIWTRVQKCVSSFPKNVCKLIPPLSREMLAAYVSAADCVVIPSLSEGFGFCVREACNANKIVVTTNAGSLPEVISGEHVFVDAGLAHALVEGCVKAYIGEVMHSPLKMFRWEKAVQLYLELYEEILVS